MVIDNVCVDLSINLNKPALYFFKYINTLIIINNIIAINMCIDIKNKDLIIAHDIYL